MQHFSSILAVLICLISLNSHIEARSGTMKIDKRSRVQSETAADYELIHQTEYWDSQNTALIICDMWNEHWCPGATERVAEMAPYMNEVVQKAREKGIFIIHAPSDVTDHYAGHPARLRAMKAPSASNLPEEIRSWCNWMGEAEEAAYPIDQSDGGCACSDCPTFTAWTKQVDAIEIQEKDAISDSGEEIWNLLESRGIQNVMLMGVHTNMCVLGRPFGLRNMARYGKNVVLIRDLTDTMYNPESWPYVDHFTGTDLIIEHIEKYVCPTITSEVLTGRPPFRFADNNGFYGMWTLSIEGGGVGWLEVHNKEGYLDADLLWVGGSVLPVSNVYFADENTLVVTRTQEVVRSKQGADTERKHTITHTLKMIQEGDKLAGFYLRPNRDGIGQRTTTFTGMKLPPVPKAPDLSKVKYSQPVTLFNGKNLDGWKLINPNSKNGFVVDNGVLVNNPVQDDGHHVQYGNLRTEKEFEDFNLQLEVKVPSGNNSGIYLRGMYEIQVFDSFGKELDSHNMGAVYSRIKPTVAAEKPAGEWQSFDITLCDRHITVILNGKKIIDNQPVYGPTGGAIIADVFAPGPIYLQGDHGKVSYRNMVLRPILD